jgi:hypothetical protein
MESVLRYGKLFTLLVVVLVVVVVKTTIIRFVQGCGVGT